MNDIAKYLKCFLRIEMRQDYVLFLQELFRFKPDSNPLVFHSHAGSIKSGQKA